MFLQLLTPDEWKSDYAWFVFTKKGMTMKVLGTALAALTLSFSGSALAERDDWRRDGDDRHSRHGGDYWSDRHDHGRHHHDHGRMAHRGKHYAPQVSNHYYYGSAPYYYAEPPRYAYRSHRHYDYRDSGVTIILPPIRIGH